MNTINRSALLTGIRPELNLEQTSLITVEENFQNQVLRPILKFQNTFLTASFLNYTQSFKLSFDTKDSTQKKELISHAITKNKHLRMRIVGGITGMMTAQELNFYFDHHHEMNKRIMKMVETRLHDQLA